MEIVILAYKEVPPLKTTELARGSSGKQVITGAMIAFSEPEVEPIVTTNGDHVMFYGVAVGAVSIRKDFIIIALKEKPHSVSRFVNTSNKETYIEVREENLERYVPPDSEIIYPTKEEGKSK